MYRAVDETKWKLWKFDEETRIREKWGVDEEMGNCEEWRGNNWIKSNVLKCTEVQTK